MLFGLGIHQRHRVMTRFLSMVVASTLAVAGVVSVGAVATAAPSDTIVINDPQLRAAINVELGQGKNRPITRDQAESLKDLQAYDMAISDLSGIENFTNLRDLVLGEHKITDIKPLANLTKLKRLALDRNQITDITPLAKLTDLQDLDLSGNKISNITPLAKLTKLRSLDLNRNQIKSVKSLEKLTKLYYLDLNRNQIKTIKPLEKLTKLQALLLDRNQIKTITPLTKLTKLRSLHLNRNQIKTITPLTKLTQLNDVFLDQNQIASIAPLKKHKNLAEFSARGQQVTLSTVKRKKSVKNPVRGISGSVVKVKSSSSGFKQTKKSKSWQFTKKGSKKVTWSVKGLQSYPPGGGIYDAGRFSGTIVQKVK